MMDQADLTRELADITVFSRVARHHLFLQEGVSGVRGTFGQWLRGASGVSVRITRTGALRIRASILVECGYSVPDVGRRVQEAIVEAMARLTARPVEVVEIRVAEITGVDQYVHPRMPESGA